MKLIRTIGLSKDLVYTLNTCQLLSVTEHFYFLPATINQVASSFMSHDAAYDPL